MRPIPVLLALVIASIGVGEALGAGAPQGPRVVLGVDAKSSQRFLQLSERGPVYPTADVNCDGNRGTVTLTRSSNAGDRTVATYAVPPKVSALMLRSAECRLMLPGREVALSRQLIHSAWSTPPQAQKH